MSKYVFAIILILLATPSWGVPINHYTDKVALSNGQIKQTVYSYPKYCKNGDFFSEVDTTISSCDDAGWDFVANGVYRMRATNSGMFEINHLGDIYTQKLIGIGFYNVETKDMILSNDIVLDEPVVSGNVITWHLSDEGTYCVIYSNDTFRDVFIMSQTVKNYLKDRIPQHWDVQNTYICLIYDMDLSRSTMIESKEFESVGDIKFVKSGRVKHKIVGTVAKHSEWDNISEKDNLLKEWRRLRVYNNGKYVEAISVSALNSPTGSLVFNTTVTFQEGVSGYSGTEFWGGNSANSDKVYHDTAMWSGEFGTDPTIYRGYLRFDVSSIPNNATVTTATFTLTFVAETVATDYYVYLYKMLKDWNEPAASADPCSDIADDPCWDYQYYNETLWGSGGAGEEDVDVDTDIVASAPITSATNTPISFQSESIDTLVEEWIQGVTANYGIGVYGQEDGASRTKQWASPTNGTSSYRPQLEVVYDVPSASIMYPRIMWVTR